jgi:probable F420-dependent oxidoreductase
MQIGLFAPATNPAATPSYLRTLARGAEERGFHSLWAAEHAVLFDEYASRYPYSADGRIPMGGEHGPLEPFGTLAFVAGVTSRIRLGTGVCLVPQRNPVYTAKEVSTLDWISAGRLDFGVGVGWLAEEFEAVQAPFERRGDRCRAYLEVMKRLWCDPVSSYEGPFYTLPPCRQYPKPIQQPHPPIHFGGESDAALRRVADLGQGWYPFSIDPDELAARLARLDAMLAKRGRGRKDIRLTVCPYLRPADLDLVKRYRDVGVDEVVLLIFASSEGELQAGLDTLARTIVEPAGRV